LGKASQASNRTIRLASRRRLLRPRGGIGARRRRRRHAWSDGDFGRELAAAVGVGVDELLANTPTQAGITIGRLVDPAEVAAPDSWWPGLAIAVVLVYLTVTVVFFATGHLVGRGCCETVRSQNTATPRRRSPVGGAAV
jgi:hypothetical protein